MVVGAVGYHQVLGLAEQVVAAQGDSHAVVEQELGYLRVEHALRGLGRTVALVPVVVQVTFESKAERAPVPGESCGNLVVPGGRLVLHRGNRIPRLVHPRPSAERRLEIVRPVGKPQAFVHRDGGRDVLRYMIGIVCRVVELVDELFHEIIEALVGILVCRHVYIGTHIGCSPAPACPEGVVHEEA